MASKTTIVYTCDGCGKEAKASELRRFTLIETKMGSKQTVVEARTDLCTSCEGRLHKLMTGVFPDDAIESMLGLVRP